MRVSSQDEVLQPHLIRFLISSLIEYVAAACWKVDGNVEENQENANADRLEDLTGLLFVCCEETADVWLNVYVLRENCNN